MSRIRIILAIFFTLLAAVTYYGRTNRYTELEDALSSAIVESFEYGYACRGAGKPHDECLAAIKKLLDY